ncbi:MAG: hypothetical protein ABI632_11585 [Pseudolysinimonas sp.]
MVDHFSDSLARCGREVDDGSGQAAREVGSEHPAGAVVEDAVGAVVDVAVGGLEQVLGAVAGRRDGGELAVDAGAVRGFMESLRHSC